MNTNQTTTIITTDNIFHPSADLAQFDLSASMEQFGSLLEDYLIEAGIEHTITRTGETLTVTADCEENVLRDLIDQVWGEGDFEVRR